MRGFGLKDVHCALRHIHSDIVHTFTDGTASCQRSVYTEKTRLPGFFFRKFPVSYEQPRRQKKTRKSFTGFSY